MDERRACRGWVTWALPALFLAAGCQSNSTGVVTRLPAPAYSPFSRVAVGPQPPVAEPPAPAKSNLDWEPSVELSNRWNCIVIHHSESDTGSLHDIDQWHRKNGWDGCGYHFVIGNGTDSADGSVEMSYRWRRQLTGAHCRLPRTEEIRRRLTENYYNEHGIGICLVGKFDQQDPTPGQLKAAAELIHYLMEECDIPESRVFGHGDLKSTSCPGRHLSVSDLKRRARALGATAKR